MAPALSVIIPTCNRAALLREALASVREQGMADIEVVVVNCGSTDDSDAVVESFQPGIKHVKQRQRLGVAAARNLGIERATAPLIAFLDDDDLWLPGKLAAQLAYLDAHPEIDMIYARLWSYHVSRPADRRLDPYVEPATTFAALLNGPNTVTTSTVVVRSACFEEVGVFNVALRASEDHELWLRIFRRFRVAFLDTVMAEYRRHGDSINTHPPLLYDGYRRYFEIILREYRADLRDPRATERQLAKFEYLWGTTLLKQGNGREALRFIRQGLARDPGLGAQFADGSSSWAQRAWLPVKPYAAFAAAFARGLAAAPPPPTGAAK
jgi:glycosyltransferase involved in cell wall biosynthesis